MGQLSSSSLSHVQNTGMHPLSWAARPSGERRTVQVLRFLLSPSARAICLRRLAYGRSAARGRKNMRSGTRCYERHVVATKNADGFQQPAAGASPSSRLRRIRTLRSSSRRVLLFLWKRNLVTVAYEQESKRRSAYQAQWQRVQYRAA